MTWEYFRCCLLRTLMSYKGVPTADGGTEFFPDLAAAEPTISDDQLTWTYTIKPGVHYGDPFTDVEVTAQDFIRALERRRTRRRTSGGTPSTTASSRDSTTSRPARPTRSRVCRLPTPARLLIELTAPTADLSYRLAMPAAAPIPPNGDAPLGAAEGHDKNYGRFLVATGPYEFEGADQLDFSVPAADQTEVAGLRPGSFDRAGPQPGLGRGDRRPASGLSGSDRGGDRWQQRRPLQQGQVERLGLRRGRRRAAGDVIQEYSTDPDLQSKINVYPSDALRYISFNFLMPPFDDIHVRKAFNWALDKDGMRQLRGGATTGEIAGHIMVNSLENNLLEDLRPVRHAELGRRHREGQSRDGAVEVRHQPGRGV